MALLDDILKLLGTNRTRVQWKVRAWKRGWERRKAALANRTSAPKSSQRARRLAGLLWPDDTPVVAGVLVLSCVLVYALVLVWQNRVGLASSKNLAPHTYALWRFGSEFSPDILDKGQWWRLVTATFLHGGLLHIAMNMLSLWSVATYLEDTLGKAKTLALYFLLGATGSLFSLWWHTRSGGIGNSVGASGAICGLIGVAVGFSMRHRNAARHLQAHYVGWAMWIVIIGMSNWNIDNAGHVGGFVPGFLLGLIVRRRQSTGKLAHRLWIAGAALAVAGVIASFVMMANSPLTHDQLFGSDDDTADNDVDDATRAAVLEAHKTFELDGDYMPGGIDLRYARAVADTKPDGVLVGRMIRLFGEPRDGDWHVRDRATGTQLRLRAGDDTFKVDGPDGDKVLAHLTELLDRAKPADFQLVWYQPGTAVEEQIHHGAFDARVLSYDEALAAIERQLADPDGNRAHVLDSALRFYTGTTGHEADKPRFAGYLHELKQLGGDVSAYEPALR